MKGLIFGVLIIVTILLPISVLAQINFNQINQKVCDRFEEDTARLAAIMDELRDRKGISETRVAFGGSDTPIKQADYWVNYAAEAIAYQRAQQYSSAAGLKSSLQTLVGKILRAKTEVGKALEDE